METPETPLQFDSAEPTAESAESLTCAVCKKTLADTYHMANQVIVCASCRAQLAREATGGSGAGRLSRGLLFGFVGAVVGAGIYYAVLAITGYEVGLIAILVGWLVGTGVSRGSNGRGGWAYQAMAVALTYLAIVSTYVPLLIGTYRTQMASDSVVLSSKDSIAAAGDTLAIAQALERDSIRTAAAADAPDPSLGQALLAIAMLVGLAAALPFLAGFSNIIGILIIGFALYQAWKMNKHVPIRLTGPFKVGGPAPA